MTTTSKNNDFSRAAELIADFLEEPTDYDQALELLNSARKLLNQASQKQEIIMAAWDDLSNTLEDDEAGNDELRDKAIDTIDSFRKAYPEEA